MKEILDIYTKIKKLFYSLTGANAPAYNHCQSYGLPHDS